MDQKKTEVGLVKRLVCGLLCAMVCATATACTTQQARPDLGQGTESAQIRDTEAPTGEQGPATGGNEGTPSGGEQTPEGGDQTPSGGDQTPTTPETPSQPATPPTASELLELCGSKMATVATFDVESKMKYELEGLGSASGAGGVYEEQTDVRVEGLGTDEQSLQCIMEEFTFTLVDGAYYLDAEGLKAKVPMTEEQYDAQFADFADAAGFLTYGAEDFGGSEIVAIEGGYRIKFKDPTNDTLREMLSLFDETYATKTWEDITEFAYTVEIAADGTLMREYLFIKFDELLDPDLYGAGAIGIVRLTYEDLYSGYGSEQMLTKPADEESYIVVSYEEIFG